MNRTHSIQQPVQRVRQSAEFGASLLVVLIFMLVLSTLATFGVRNVRLLQRQAVSEQEYQLARQAAEAAMADAVLEIAWVNSQGSCVRQPSLYNEKKDKINSAAFDSTCPRGLCKGTDAQYAQAWASANSSSPGAPWWPTSKGGQWGNNANADGSPNFNCNSATGGVPLGTYTGAAAFPRVVRQPEYLLEIMSSKYKCPRLSPDNTIATNVVYSAANESVALGTNDRPTSACTILRVTARGFGTSRTNGDSDVPVPQVEVVLQGYVHILE